MAYRIRTLLSVVVDLIMAVIAFFLGMRVIFELFSANPATPFVNWIYGVSGGLMTPFANLFPNLAIPGLGFLDIVALVTLLAYAVVGYIALAIIRSVLAVGDYSETRHHHWI